MICKLALISLAQTPAEIRACVTVHLICSRKFSGISQASMALTEACAAAFSLLSLRKGLSFCIHLSAVLTTYLLDWILYPPCSSLLYIFILALRTIESYVYPDFFLQVLSLTVVSHAGYFPLPPLHPTPTHMSVW